MRFFAAIMILGATAAHAQSFLCEDQYQLDDALMACYRLGPEPAPPPAPFAAPDPFKLRLLKYAALAVNHRLGGLASYYSTSLEGTLTANGERYRHTRLTAAHLTLPLGCWVELKSRATGKSIRVRVNDRGPYVKKFAIDLSQSAARALGVDRAEDRWVEIRIIALPGEEPLPREIIAGPAERTVAEEVGALR
jgi:rare lipoprotein A